MRLFLAIDIPGEAKASLNRQLAPLQKEYPVFNWVQEGNYHLTVHFFGETQDYTRIINETRSILFEQEPFYLYATHLDVFLNHQITIYANFRRERALEDLISRSRESFSADFAEVKQFIPHITVARTRVPSKQQYFHLLKKIERTNIDLEFKVQELTLFESILTAKKPVYRKVANFPFAQSV